MFVFARIDRFGYKIIHTRIIKRENNGDGLSDSPEKKKLSNSVTLDFISAIFIKGCILFFFSTKTAYFFKGQITRLNCTGKKQLSVFFFIYFNRNSVSETTKAKKKEIGCKEAN